MGYAHYTITRNGEEIEAGYGVDTECETPDCTEGIDRGLAFLCGDIPGDNEHGCGGYHCGKHMFMASVGDWDGQLCGPCAEKLGNDETEED